MTFPISSIAIKDTQSATFYLGATLTTSSFDLHSNTHHWQKRQLENKCKNPSAMLLSSLPFFLRTDKTCLEYLIVTSMKTHSPL